jgi:hypothetical protein
MFVQQLDKAGVVKRLQIAAKIDLASSPAAGLGVQIGQLSGAQDDQTEGNAVLAEHPLVPRWYDLGPARAWRSSLLNHAIERIEPDQPANAQPTPSGSYEAAPDLATRGGRFAQG